MQLLLQHGLNARPIRYHTVFFNTTAVFAVAKSVKRRTFFRLFPRRSLIFREKHVKYITKAFRPSATPQHGKEPCAPVRAMQSMEPVRTAGRTDRGRRMNSHS